MLSTNFIYLYALFFFARSEKMFCEKILESYDDIGNDSSRELFGITNLWFVARGLNDVLQLHNKMPKLKRTSLELLIKLKDVANDIDANIERIMCNPEIGENYHKSLSDILLQIGVYLETLDVEDEIRFLYLEYENFFNRHFAHNIFNQPYAFFQELYLEFLTKMTNLLCEGEAEDQPENFKRRKNRYYIVFRELHKTHRKFDLLIKYFDEYIDRFITSIENPRFYTFARTLFKAKKKQLVNYKKDKKEMKAKKQGKVAKLFSKPRTTYEILCDDPEYLERSRVSLKIKMLEEFSRYFN